MEKIRSNKKLFTAVLVAFLLGILWVVAIRFVTLDKKEVHYHANFAVFINGDRVPFDNFTFYEEIAACGGNGIDSPKIRAHMHDQINHVVHIHDNGVTWGNFFENIGFANGDNVFKTREEVFVEDKDTGITFILNNQEVDTTANRTIGDEDVLLVSIGDNSEEELKQQYDQIEQDADVYNQNDDPSACSGGKPLTLVERLKVSIGISE
jgi:hypothetical protein